MSDLHEIFEMALGPQAEPPPRRLEECRNFGELRAFVHAENVTYVKLDLQAKRRLGLITPAAYDEAMRKLEGVPA